MYRWSRSCAGAASAFLTRNGKCASPAAKPDPRRDGRRGGEHAARDALVLLWRRLCPQLRAGERSQSWIVDAQYLLHAWFDERVPLGISENIEALLANRGEYMLSDFARTQRILQ